MKKRTIILMLDSVGIGYADDADKFNDVGSNTFCHIADFCEQGKAENRGGDYGEDKHGGLLNVPNLQKLGIAHAAEKASGVFPNCLTKVNNIIGSYGYAAEISSGKDTPSGHWEMAGSPVLYDWGYFSKLEDSFPKDLLDRIVKKANIPGYLGNCHASGTVIIADLGEEHIKTGKPIFYTSADSVFQIACHEESFGLDRLYDLCEIVRDELNQIKDYKIGRVIARPFVGGNSCDFQRTGNRHDYAIEPPYDTVLKKLSDSGGEVISIGKIADIYAHVGPTKKYKATGLVELWDKTLDAVKTASDNSIIFTNFVDFDSSYGHRRNAAGYAAALEYFDSRLPELYPLLREDDLLLVTADHGNDPTWTGTEHTREYVPMLWYGSEVPVDKYLGKSSTFADMGQTIASYMQLQPMDFGSSVFEE